jgi:hypothetical protein
LSTKVGRISRESLKRIKKESSKPVVTVEAVNRVLEVGRLLFSVLSEEEIEELHRILNGLSDDFENR